MLAPALVVSPLRIEARVLRRALARREAAVSCCGPGAAAIERWFEERRDEPAPAIAILAGLAGALSAGCAAGSAHLVTEVIGPAGERLSAHAREGTVPCTITSAAHVVGEVQEKRALSRASGADLVDLESLAFANAARSRGWRWLIVRGVSDDARTALPRTISSWIDDRGSLRVGRVALDLAARPCDLPRSLALARDSQGALRAAAKLITSLIAP